jgi:hypothetical protein
MSIMMESDVRILLSGIILGGLRVLGSAKSTRGWLRTSSLYRVGRRRAIPRGVRHKEDVTMQVRPWCRFWQRIIAVLVAVGCVVGVLLLTAQNPSADEVTRGAPAGVAGIVAFIILKLFEAKE